MKSMTKKITATALFGVLAVHQTVHPTQVQTQQSLTHQKQSPL